MYSLLQYLRTLESPFGLTRTLEGWQLCRRADGRPWFAAGNTALVFRIRRGSEVRALRCYRRPMRHLREIYGDRLREGELYLYTGPDCGRWVDAVVDDWIEGGSLRGVLGEAARRRDRQQLEELSEAFDALAARLLADAGAHGDLKPENILVDAAGRLHLIDFDTAYLPCFAGERSPELGTAAYQHPARTPEDFHDGLDDYPIALISAALHALALRPELFDRYGDRDGLLFDPPHAACDEALHEVLALFEAHGLAACYRLTQLLQSPTLRLPQLPPLLEAVRHEAAASREGCKEAAAQAAEVPELFVEGGRWGYRDTTKTVVPPLYDCGFDFTEGLAAVRLGRTWHYLDLSGRPVLHCPDCEAVKPFRNGTAVVLRNGQRCRIDRTGKLIE